MAQSAVAARLQLKRKGPHDYGLTFFPDEPSKRVDVRVIGHFSDAREDNSVAHSQWVWSVYVNGKLLQSKETLTRKKDAVALLTTELTRRGLLEGSESVADAPTEEEPTVSLSQASDIAVEAAKVAAAQSHPLFANAVGNTNSHQDSDSRVGTMIRIKGTTIVGTVTEVVAGQKTRFKIEFPSGQFAWAEESVSEPVIL